MKIMERQEILENELQSSSSEYVKKINPILTINIVNMSDKIIRDVELFDYDNKNSGTINYYSLNSAVSYKEILRHLSSLRGEFINVEGILIDAKENNGKEIEQAKKTISISSKSLNGRFECKNIKVKTNNHQHRKNMAVLNTYFKLYYNTNILLSELLPLQTITISIYSDTKIECEVYGYFESSVGLIFKNKTENRIENVSILNNEDDRIIKSSLIHEVDYLSLMKTLKKSGYKFFKLYTETDGNKWTETVDNRLILVFPQADAIMNIKQKGSNHIPIKLSEQETIVDYVIDEDTEIELDFIEPNTEIRVLFIKK